MKEDEKLIEKKRLKERFISYKKGLGRLREAVKSINKKMEIDEILQDILKEGLIQRFEYTHELAWNLMKNYAEYQGNATIRGSRDATREAFKMQLITNADTWMDMIKSRNKTSHIYDENLIDAIYEKILNDYYTEFEAFYELMNKELF